MPNRCKKNCAVPGCPNLASGRHCEEHTKNKWVARPHDQRRGSAASRGYDRAWEKIRVVALMRDHYLCQHCLKVDKLTPAKDVDHIIALSKGGERLDLDNLMSLCGQCHKIKTAKEDGSWGRPKTLPGTSTHTT